MSVGAGAPGVAEPLARVALSAKAPAELVSTLTMLRIEVLDVEDSDRAQLIVDFDSPRTPAERAPIMFVHVRSRTGGPPQSIAFATVSTIAAACFILSRVLDFPEPFLTTDRETFAMLRAALAIGAGPAHILIEGETGTGKESLGRLIHASRTAGTGELIRVDCAALDPGALTAPPWESGAGATTVLLDRIDELPSGAQQELIAAMRRACGRRPAADVPHFIAASTMGSGPQHDHGLLSPELQELFEVSLRIPPLRWRPDDIVMLARYFLHDQNSRLALSAGALRTLRYYPFPGNIRELRNLMTRLAIVPLAQHSGAIGAGELVTQLAPVTMPEGAGGSLWQLTHEKSRIDAARRALAAFDGDVVAAAKSLGADSPALIRLTTAAVPKNPRPRKRRSRSHRIH